MLKKIKSVLVKNKKSIAILMLILITSLFLWNKIKNNPQDNLEKITYNEFMTLVEDHKVDTVLYNKNNEWMTVTLFNSDTKDMSVSERLEYEDYTELDMKLVLYPATEEFRRDLLVNDVLLAEAAEDTNLSAAFTKITSLTFPIAWLIILIIMFKSSLSPEMNKGDIMQKSYVGFDDVIGHDEILDDLKFISKLIKDPTIGDSIGAQIPKGILLSGSPGCGKTLIAKAIAGESGVPFLYQNASSFVDRFVGMGAKHVREIFKMARKSAPCVLFIDEIDAIGMDRDKNKGNSEHDQTIDALLQEMDGFGNRDGIFIIAATNRPEILDKALVRAGRFDRQIEVAAPRNWKIRKDLFDHYLKKFKIAENVDTENLSKQVSGFTGADIATICNEASIVAVMNNKEAIDESCIEEAIDKKVFKGNRAKKNHFIKDREIVAYHEAGHAIMSYLLGEPIARASIQSTVSGVGGAVFNSDKDDGLLKTKEDFENRICICYAGRASEEIKFNSITTGASNDITQATEIMTSYIEQLGFDSDFGLVDATILNNNRLIDNSEITKRISEMSKQLYKKCKTELKDNYNLVESLAQKLLEHETLSGSEINELLS